MFRLRAYHTSESVLQVTKAEQKEMIERLMNQGSMRGGYYLLLLLAVLITTPGLLLDNAAVIIGGMILAPLFVPIASLSLSIVSLDAKGMMRAFSLLLISVALTLMISWGFALIVSHSEQAIHWIPDDISPGLYFFIALCSGVAGGFSMVKKNLATTAAGVAIAVSLLPPLCAAGIALALENYLLLKNSLVLFGINVCAITVAVTAVLWILRFSRVARFEKQVVQEETE